MADVDLIDQGGPFTHLDELVRFANSVFPGRPDRSRRLLDLRCGTGSLVRAFAPHGWEAVGVDASMTLTEAAAKLQPDSMRAEFFLSSTTLEIDLRDQRFDLVVAFDDMAEILLDPVQFEHLVTLAHGLLVPTGLLIFQLERTTAFSTIDSRLELLRTNGFDSAWRTSPSNFDMAVPSNVDHAGTRDLFVARRGV